MTQEILMRELVYLKQQLQKDSDIKTKQIEDFKKSLKEEK